MIYLPLSQFFFYKKHPAHFLQAILSEGGLYAFQIRARELIPSATTGSSPGSRYGSEVVTNVTIVVTDVDDMVPAFNREDFSVAVPEDPAYAAWGEQSFSSLTPRELTAKWADPENDGLSNFFEYATGTSPEATDTAITTSVATLQESADQRFHLRLPSENESLAFALQTSPDAKTWTPYPISFDRAQQRWTSDQPELTIEKAQPNDSGKWDITLTLAAPTSPRFARLSVSKID